MATNENNPCTCTTPEYTIILNQQGPSGRQGETGQDGFSPIIDVNTNTRDTYILTITTADGVITTPNLKSEPIPSGGTEGQVLTNTGQDNYGWAYLPQATPQSQGVVRLSTDEDFQPDEEGNVNDTSAVTPQTLVDYVSTHSGSDLKNITDIEGGVQVDGLHTGNDSDYRYVLRMIADEADEVGAERVVSIQNWLISNNISSSGIDLQPREIVLRGVPTFYTSGNGTPALQFEFREALGSSDLPVCITRPIFKSSSDSWADQLGPFQENPLMIEFIHGTEDPEGEYHSNSIGIYQSQTSNTFNNDAGILFTIENNEPRIDFVTTSGNFDNPKTDTVIATVLTNNTGISSWEGTSTEYSAIETKDYKTLYRLTDTNKVYLGDIELTGGSGTIAAITTTVNAPPQCVSEVENITTSVTIEDYVPPVEE